MLRFVGSRLASRSDGSHSSDMQSGMGHDGTDDGFHDQAVGGAQYDNVLDEMLHAPDLKTMMACADQMSSGPSLFADARHGAKVTDMVSAVRHSAQGGVGQHVAGKAWSI